MSDLILISPVESSLPTPAGDVPVLEISLGEAPRGLAVLLHESRTPAIDVVEAMNRLALEGYESLAVAADVDVRDVFERARLRGWAADQIGMVGFGSGATRTLDAAREHCFGAAVSFAPVPDVGLVQQAPALRTPWLGLFGADDAPPSDDLAALAQALEGGSDVFSQVVAYPGVGSDFFRGADSGIGHAASYDGWQRAVEWLNVRVAARLTPLAEAWRDRGRAGAR
jgi:hypothetical protein